MLEALSRSIYDPSVHLRDCETEPPADETKQRLGRYVEDSLAGKDNEAIRGVANKVIELAQREALRGSHAAGGWNCGGLGDHAREHLAPGGSGPESTAGLGAAAVAPMSRPQFDRAATGGPGVSSIVPASM